MAPHVTIPEVRITDKKKVHFRYGIWEINTRDKLDKNELFYCAHYSAAKFPHIPKFISIRFFYFFSFT